MPKRVIDFDALWGSDKLAACADWAQAEYAWLYGLADASGCFEITNLRVIWGRVAAVRGNFTIERLEQVFREFQDKGLLFVWEHEGKRYAHWTGSDVPGRLPPPSWRMRLEKFAPPVPKARLAEYMAHFARGRAVLARSEFRGEDAEGQSPRAAQEHLKFESSDFKVGAEGDRNNFGMAAQGCDSRHGDGETSVRMATAAPGRWREFRAPGASRETGLNGGVEDDQEQDLDLDLNLNLKRNEKKEWERGGAQFVDVGMEAGRTAERKIESSNFSNSNTNSKANATAEAKALIEGKQNFNGPASAETNCETPAELNSGAPARAGEACGFRSTADAQSPALRKDWRSATEDRRNAREIAVQRELRVGAGPVCGPVGIRPEVWERIRLREEARARARAAAARGG